SFESLKLLIDNYINSSTQTELILIMAKFSRLMSEIHLTMLEIEHSKQIILEYVEFLFEVKDMLNLDNFSLSTRLNDYIKNANKTDIRIIASLHKLAELINKNTETLNRKFKEELTFYTSYYSLVNSYHFDETIEDKAVTLNQIARTLESLTTSIIDIYNSEIIHESTNSPKETMEKIVEKVIDGEFKEAIQMLKPIVNKLEFASEVEIEITTLDSWINEFSFKIRQKLFIADQEIDESRNRILDLFLQMINKIKKQISEKG
ncbi:MAG: hypothetical protein AAFZ15_27820, partial [Bacteroidota bacterium]